MHTVSSLPPDLTRLLFDAGQRAVVLVEGPDDREVLREWFREHLAEVEFFDCGGFKQIEKLLNELLNSGSLKRAWGIIDRDFRGEQEVAHSYAEDSHLFVLPRYALENYLLEATPLLAVMKVRFGEKIPASMVDEAAMENYLLELCRRLKSLMAAHWVFYETNVAQQRLTGETAKIEYFSKGHDTDRTLLVQQSANRLKCSTEDAEAKLVEKENGIEPHLADLNSAHKVIDGKRLLHWIHREQFKTGEEDYLRRLLTREAALHKLPDDIVIIVRDRILSFVPPAS